MDLVVKKGLDIVKRSLSHITHSKNINGSNLLLCTHCGRDDHLNTNYPIFEESEDRWQGILDKREEDRDLVLG